METTSVKKWQFREYVYRWIKNETVDRCKESHRILILIVKLLFVLVLLCTAGTLYSYGTKFRSLESLISNKSKIYASMSACCGVLIMCTFFVFFFSGKGLLLRCLFLIIQGSVFLLLWYRDQRFVTQGDVEFGYGYYTSRGLIVLYFVGLIPLCLVYMCIRYAARRCPMSTKLMGAVFLILCGIVAVSCVQKIRRRKIDFNAGLFGEVALINETKCRADEDTFIWTSYLPKHFFHSLLFTYWCKTHPEFSTIVDQRHDESALTTILIRGCRADSIEISKIPVFRSFEFKDVRSVSDEYPYSSVFSKNIDRRTVKEEIELKENEKGSDVKFVFDSNKYETIYVKCGKKRNVVVAPSKFRMKKGGMKEKGIYKDGRRRRPPLKVGKVNGENSPNIYLLFVDSMSRKHFERDFAETNEYLSKLKREEKKKKSDIEIFQFFQYSTIGDNTFPNMLGMLNGKIEQNLVPIHEMAKEMGYLTVLTENYCNEWGALYNHMTTLGGPLEDEQYLSDYIHLETFCDESYTSRKTEFSIWKGAYSAARKCLFSKESHEYVLEYTQKIETLWPTTPKFVYAGLLDAHSPFGESIRYVDHNYKVFLEWMYESGVMSNSLVFFLSDHGSGISLVAQPFKEGRVEGNHPFFLMLSPSKYLNKKAGSRNRLNANRQRLITSIDIHKTFCGVLGLGCGHNDRGIDLINEIVPRERTCEEAGINQEFCIGLRCEE